MKEQNSNHDWIEIIKISLFAVNLFMFCIIGFLFYLRPDTSILEKRALAKFPDFTWNAFWVGSYFKQIDIWYSDTYPLREKMIGMSKKVESLYGVRDVQIVEGNINEIAKQAENQKKEAESEVEEQLPDGTVRDIGEVRGSVYIVNNCGYEMYTFMEDLNMGFVASMNLVYSRIKDKVDNMYVMLLPTGSGAMLDKQVLDDMQCSDESVAMNYVYDRLNEGIHPVRTIDILRKHNAEYIYFHTDHHWTALGAYYAYTAFCKEKGWKPHDYNDYEKREFPNFLGSFYSYSRQSPAIAANPDTIIAYVPKGTNKMKMTMPNGVLEDWEIISDATNYPTSSKYETFVGGDAPFSYAHNETITDGSAAVVIKDSMGNAFIPWLIDHYEYVYWIDARYTKNTISQLVRDYHIQDVIYEVGIYGASNQYLHKRYSEIGR